MFGIQCLKMNLLLSNMEDKGLDIGLFEPFRNNIIEYSTDGYFKVRLNNPINFDKDLIKEYFTDFMVSYDRDYPSHNFSVTFSVWAISDQVKSILLSMSFTFTMTQWPE